MEKWREKRACLGIPTAVFFPERGDFATLQKAKEICGACPVKAECLDDCLAAPQENDWHGIYGGIGPRQRLKIRQARAKGWVDGMLAGHAEKPPRKNAKKPFGLLLHWDAEKQKYICVDRKHATS